MSECYCHKNKLKFYETKTEYINNCQNNNTISQIKTSKSRVLKEVEDYKYLGSYVSSSEKDFNVRKGMAWSASNDMRKIWESNMSIDLKIQIFRATVESILLYGSETWTMTAKIRRRLDGTYTRLLMRTQNISWRQHPTRELIYGILCPVSSLVIARRVQFAGHCCRAQREIISSLLLWRPQPHGRRRRNITFGDTISRDTGIAKEDLKTAMQDREYWRGVVCSMISTAVER